MKHPDVLGHRVVSMRKKEDAEKAVATKRVGPYVIERVLTPIQRVANRWEFEAWLS